MGSPTQTCLQANELKEIAPIQVSDRFFHSNGTSHLNVISAASELVDNAEDEGGDVWIDIVSMDFGKPDGIQPVFRVRDNGRGMPTEKMIECFSFGFSDKAPDKKGYFGNGLKSSTGHIGSEVLVVSMCDGLVGIGLLSGTFQSREGVKHIRIPLVSWDASALQSAAHEGLPALPAPLDESMGVSLRVIMQYSMCSTEASVWEFLKGFMKSKSGTQSGCDILVYSLLDVATGKPRNTRLHDLDLSVAGDIRIKLSPKLQRKEIDISMRRWLEYLYLRTDMQIYLQGEKVEQKQLYNAENFEAAFWPVAAGKKSSVEYSYAEEEGGEGGRRAPVRIGVHLKRRGGDALGAGEWVPDTEEHGALIYYKNRLVKAFEPLGPQRLGSGIASGIVAVVNATALSVAHNKREFQQDDESYHKCIDEITKRVEAYIVRTGSDLEQSSIYIMDGGLARVSDEHQEWCERLEAARQNNLRLDENSDQCVQCDACCQYRTYPDAVKDEVEAAEPWLCSMNHWNPAYASCDAEMEDPELRVDYEFAKQKFLLNKGWEWVTQAVREYKGREGIPGLGTQPQSDGSYFSFRLHEAYFTEDDLSEHDDQGRKLPRLVVVPYRHYRDAVEGAAKGFDDEQLGGVSEAARWKGQAEMLPKIPQGAQAGEQAPHISSGQWGALVDFVERLSRKFPARREQLVRSIDRVMAESGWVRRNPLARAGGGRRAHRRPQTPTKTAAPPRNLNAGGAGRGAGRVGAKRGRDKAGGEKELLAAREKANVAASKARASEKMRKEAERKRKEAEERAKKMEDELRESRHRKRQRGAEAEAGEEAEGGGGGRAEAAAAGGGGGGRTGRLMEDREVGLERYCVCSETPENCQHDDMVQCRTCKDYGWFHLSCLHLDGDRRRNRDGKVVISCSDHAKAALLARQIRKLEEATRRAPPPSPSRSHQGSELDSYGSARPAASTLLRLRDRPSRPLSWPRGSLCGYTSTNVYGPADQLRRMFAAPQFIDDVLISELPEDHHVQVANPSEVQQGLYANGRDWSKGETMEYVGEVMEDEDRGTNMVFVVHYSNILELYERKGLARRAESVRKDMSNKGKGPKAVAFRVDAKRYGNETRFINDPFGVKDQLGNPLQANAQFKVDMTADGNICVLVELIADVKDGSEFLVSYGDRDKYPL